MKYNPLDPLGHTYDEWRPSKLNFMDDGGDSSSDSGGSGDGTGFGDFGSGFDSGFSGLSDGGFDAGNFGGFGDAVAGDSLGFGDSGGFGGFDSGGNFGGFGDTSVGDSLGFADSGGNFGGFSDTGGNFGDSLGFADSGGNFGGFDSVGFGDAGGNFGGFGDFGSNFGNFGVDNLASNDFFGNFLGPTSDNLGNFDTFGNYGSAGWDSTFGNNMTADWGLSPAQAAAQSYGWGPGDYASFAGMNSAPAVSFGPESGFYGLDTTGRGAPSFDETGFISNAVGAPGFNLGSIFNQDPSAMPSLNFTPGGRDFGDLYNTGPFSDPTGGAKAAPGDFFGTRGDLGPQDPAASNFFSSLVAPANANISAQLNVSDLPGYHELAQQMQDQAQSGRSFTSWADNADFRSDTPGVFTKGNEQAQEQFDRSMDPQNVIAFDKGSLVTGLDNPGLTFGPGTQFGPAGFQAPANANQYVANAFEDLGPTNMTTMGGPFGITSQQAFDPNPTAGHQAFAGYADPMAAMAGFPSAAVMGKGDEYSQVGLASNPYNALANSMFVGGGPFTGPSTAQTGMPNTSVNGQFGYQFTGRTNPDAAPAWASNVTAGLNFSPAAAAMSPATVSNVAARGDLFGTPDPANAVSIAGGRGDFNTIFADVQNGARGADVAAPSYDAFTGAISPAGHIANTAQTMDQAGNPGFFAPTGEAPAFAGPSLSQSAIGELQAAGVPAALIGVLMQAGIDDAKLAELARDGTLAMLVDMVTQMGYK